MRDILRSVFSPTCIYQTTEGIHQLTEVLLLNLVWHTAQQPETWTSLRSLGFQGSVAGSPDFLVRAVCVIFAVPRRSFSASGSVFQWIEFEIPILKMQVRFLPGLPPKQTGSGTFFKSKSRLGPVALVCPEATDEGGLLQEVRKTRFYFLGGTHNIEYMMPLPHCVYILFSQKDHLLYIGYTTNIVQRVGNHNEGKATSTAARRPLNLIFCEFYLFESDARKREMYFKTTMGKKAIKLMLGSTLMKLGYRGTIGINFSMDK